MNNKLIVFALVATLSLGAFAQFDDGGGSAPRQAWTQFKLPKKKMKLDFRNANIDMVISLFTKTSGITIIKDPSLTQPITLTSAKQVPLNEAFEILNAALSVRNFEMRKEGNLLLIRQKQQQGGRGGSSRGGSSEDIAAMMQAFGGGNSNTELKVYDLEFANASQVARVINDVFNQQNNPFGNFNRGNFGGGNFGGRGGRQPGGGFSLGSQPTVRASADEYSNTVIVNAPKSTHSQISDLLKQIDKESDTPMKSKVYKLVYAGADLLQPVVQNVLQSNVPRGRGGANANQPVDRQFSFFPFGGNQNRNNQAAGSVVAELRTNSLIVTTTDTNQSLVETVIKELDTEVKLEATTFVFPLENARADQISTLFQQAFGTRQGTRGGGGNTGTANRNNQNRNNQNRNNQNRTNPLQGGGGTQSSLTPDEMVLALSDPNADSGDLATSIDVQDQIAQFFGGGQQQQQQNRQNQGATGRDASGRLIQVQDLTNQITVIPDQNTNSIIVVTTPENAELLRQILAQLDKIPEQVMIETIIVEASLDAQSKLGIEWQFLEARPFDQAGGTAQGNQDFGLRQGTTLPQGFRYTLNTANVTAFVNAMKTDTKFNVLSTPRIFTSNNVEAQINISQRVPFVVSQREDANGNLTFNYDFEDVGIVLTVTPRITAGGYVTMDVSQTANDLQGFTSFNAPIVNQRQADTTVAVKDGETIILGGIIRSTVSSTVKKIPILGDLPLLGQIFRSTDRTNQKTELLVFLTPRVVKNPEDAAKMTEEQRTRLSKPTQDQLKRVIKDSKKEEKVDKDKEGGK
ncbi:MAG: hypothetical protein HONBIEJF_01248 [Fimbriimonadaceae bacterium]|nr:hypothetical protein [Fimbriimonadaceae bacterium]